MSRFESPATGMYIDWVGNGKMATKGTMGDKLIELMNEAQAIYAEAVEVHNYGSRSVLSEDQQRAKSFKINELRNRLDAVYRRYTENFPPMPDRELNYMTVAPLYFDPSQLLEEGNALVNQLAAEEMQRRNEAAQGLMKLSAATMGKLTSVKTGSAVNYTEAKTKNVVQAIWFAIKDLATEDNGSILSILREALDLVVRPVKSLAEREGKQAGIQFLTQIYRTLKQMAAAGLRTIMESVGITSALGGDIYVAMHKLADALADTPRVENILNDADKDGDAGNIETGDEFFDELEKVARRCQKIKKMDGFTVMTNRQLKRAAAECAHDGYITYP